MSTWTDDPYAAPDPTRGSEDGRDKLTGLPISVLISVACMLLLAPAILTGCGTVLTAVMTIVALFVDIPTDPGDPPMYVIAPIESCMCMVPTMLYGLAAIGVFRRAQWGWYLGLLGFALWMGGCGMPVGLFGIYALVCEGSRRAFGIGPTD